VAIFKTRPHFLNVGNIFFRSVQREEERAKKLVRKRYKLRKRERELFHLAVLTHCL